MMSFGTTYICIVRWNILVAELAKPKDFIVYFRCVCIALCLPVKLWLQLRFDYDTTTIRRYYEGSDRNCDMCPIRLRYDYDPTTTYLWRLLPFDAFNARAKLYVSIFRRSCVVVISQSNRTQIVISITSIAVECVVVSSYCSRICDIGFSAWLRVLC